MPTRTPSRRNAIVSRVTVLVPELRDPPLGDPGAYRERLERLVDDIRGLPGVRDARVEKPTVRDTEYFRDVTVEFDGPETPRGLEAVVRGLCVGRELPPVLVTHSSPPA